MHGSAADISKMQRKVETKHEISDFNSSQRFGFYTYKWTSFALFHCHYRNSLKESQMKLNNNGKKFKS